MKMKMKIKTTRPDIQIPFYAKDGDAGFDLRSTEEVLMFDNAITAIPTGIHISVPKGYTGLVVPRSGQAKRGLTVANAPGIVDSKYTGEVLVLAHNVSGDAIIIAKGERIAQMVIVPYLDVEFEVVEELDATDRGDAGFGSTGTG